MSVALFFQLLACAVSLAAYMLSLETNTLLGFRFCIAITGMLNVLTATYIYCLLSENVTLDLGAVGAIFYHCAWYQLAVKQQQLFVAPIQRGQFEFRMTGLGLVECSLRAFTVVSLSLSPVNRHIDGNLDRFRVLTIQEVAIDLKKANQAG